MDATDADGPCEDAYSDIRTDSFMELTSEGGEPNINPSQNNLILSSSAECSVSQAKTAGKSESIDATLTDGPDLLFLNSSGNHGNKDLNEALKCTKTETTNGRVDIMRDALSSSGDHTNSSSILLSSKQKENLVHSEEGQEMLVVPERNVQNITDTDGEDTLPASDVMASSCTDQNDEVKEDNSTIKFEHNQANQETEQVSRSSPVKVVTTESEGGTLQMFLVDDPDSDSGVNSGGNNSDQLLTSGQKRQNESQDSSVNEKDMPKGEDVQVKEERTEKAEVQEEGKTERITRSSSERKNYDRPSRRSLRLKAGKRSIPSFTYKLMSDEEDQDLMEIENAIMTMKANESKTGKSGKAKSSGRKPGASTRLAAQSKFYTCDECNITCRTMSNLKQHKQTHLVRKPFTCPQCDYSCKRKSDLKKHEETHGPKNTYQCMLCDYSGKRLKYLKKHMRTHSKDSSSFSCHLCDYRSKNKVALDNHLSNHVDVKPHNCAECGEGFEEESEYEDHLKSHPSDNSFPCEICGATFQKKDQLKKHEVKHKKKIQVKTEASGDENSKNVNNGCDDRRKIRLKVSKTKVKGRVKKESKVSGTYGFMKMKGGPIQCSLCNYSCATKNLLRRHMRRHSDSKPHICTQCGASFKRRDHLKVHKFTHSDLRPHQCPHCSYGTHRKYRLTLHILTHQTIKPIKCSECSYSCRRDCELRYHMRNKHDIELTPPPAPAPPPKAETVVTETGTVELKCSLCDYTCDSQKRLKYHMARHENKTPHACPHCDYKCSSRSSLTDHLLQHAGIKPCLCSVCGMAFRNTSRLNRHKLVHSDVKPYGCDFCDFSSRSKYNLKQHMLRHTDQDRVRRRNRRSTKPKASPSSATEVIKQSYQPDIQAILGHMGANLYPETAQTQPEPAQLAQDSQDNLRFMSSPHTGPVPQYFGRNQMNMNHEHLKQRERHYEQSSNSSFCASSYQTPSAAINPFQVDRSVSASGMNPGPAYGDPYQHPNPFFSHTNPMSYNPNMNMGHTNPNFCYMDRSGGYGFSNPYFYNETVFPGNMNPNMNFYMGSSNPYPINHSPSLSMNQTPAHANPPVNHIARPPPAPMPVPTPVIPAPAPPPAPVPTPVLPPIQPPAIPSAESKIQSILEAEDSQTGDLTLSEDVSVDTLIDAATQEGKPLSKSQAKKTGATLDNGSLSSKTSPNDSAGKSTHICSECGYICLTNTMLQRHKTTHLDLKPHKCEDCGKAFKRRDHMKAHKRIHNEDKPFGCKHCTYTCSRKYRLKLHEMTHTNELVFPCQTCEVTFNTEEELEEHKKSHDGGTIYSCQKCDFKCETKAELRLHSETHKTFLCEHCSYVCRSTREFKSHKRMHAEKEELMCSICSYTCDSQKRLKYHMERHENKTPHSCPQCDYKCSSRSSLTDHLLQHEGLKPFLCSTCGMRFRNVSRLNRHKLTHTDIKPHTCDYCPFSSRSRYNLKQHMLRHFKQ